MCTYFIARKGSGQPERFNGKVQTFNSKDATLQFVKEWCAEKLVEAGKNVFTDYIDFIRFYYDASKDAVCLYDDTLHWFVTYDTLISNPNVDNSLESFVSLFLQFYNIKYGKVC